MSIEIIHDEEEVCDLFICTTNVLDERVDPTECRLCDRDRPVKPTIPTASSAMAILCQRLDSSNTELGQERRKVSDRLIVASG